VAATGARTHACGRRPPNHGPPGRNPVPAPAHPGRNRLRAAAAAGDQPACGGPRGLRRSRKKRDACSFVGGFEWRGQFIGSIRFIPIGQGLAPCETILPGARLAPELLTDGWEVGRLVLAPEYRSNAEILKTCLLLTFMQFLDVTERANAYATCTPALGRLYRRFGFTVLQKEACRIDGEPYSLIHGTVESVREAIARARAPVEVEMEALA
jgi:hypothetical protein